MCRYYSFHFIDYICVVVAKSGKISFKDTIAEFSRLKGVISAKSYSPIYLLMGEESYFIDRLTDILEQTILDESQKAFNQIVVYGKDSDSGNIINLCRQMPMMGGYQVVIVKEAQQLKKIEELGIYAKNPSLTTILVVCHKDKSVDKRSQFYKNVSVSGVVFESITPRDYEIGGWLNDFIRSRGNTIDPNALNMLTDHLGVDISKISNELRKLLLYLPEGTKHITADHIEQNIGISKDFNNFELTKAISERNMERALLIADHFARNPKDNPTIVTIMALFGHFQRIFLLNYQIWLTKNKGAQMPSDVELSTMMKLPSPFFLKEYKSACALYPNRKVFTILGLLREYDMKSKGMNSGGSADGEILRELLLKIFLI